jgi:hypothetical protein
MDISPARNVRENGRHEALAAGRFGEIFVVFRNQDALPDPDVFTRRFVENQRWKCSATDDRNAHDFGEGPDALGRVA